MFIFSIAKNNLLAKFKARFSPNQNGEGYLFYRKESDQGYACDEKSYLKFTSDFRKFLKLMTRTMWIWFLTGMPLIIGLVIWQDYEFHSLEKIVIIILPFPFLIYKGLKVYNAPDVLVVGKRPIANFKSHQQIFESRIKGMHWSMLIAMVVVPIVGVYVFLNDTSLLDWQISLGVCFFLTFAIIGGYLIFRKCKP